MNEDHKHVNKVFAGIAKKHGRYQNVNEDHKHVNKVFAGMQRVVRNKWPEYEGVSAYKPPTCQSFAERLTKNSKSYEAFFKDSEHSRSANVVDCIDFRSFLVKDTGKKLLLKRRKGEPQRQAKMYHC